MRIIVKLQTITRIKKKLKNNLIKRGAGTGTINTINNGFLNSMKHYAGLTIKQQVNITENIRAMNPVFIKFDEMRRSGYDDRQILDYFKNPGSEFYKIFKPKINFLKLDKPYNLPTNVSGGFSSHYNFIYEDPRFIEKINLPLSHNSNTKAITELDDSGNQVIISTALISNKDIFGKIMDQYMWFSAKTFGTGVVTTSSKFPINENNFLNDNFDFFAKKIFRDFSHTTGENGNSYYEKIDSIGTIIRIYVPTVKVFDDYLK